MLNNYLDNIFNKINIKFDEEQKQVIGDNHKNCLVLAGAGCGKTTVISAKVKYLIEVQKINFQDILVISFTRETVNDLKKQINNILDIPINIKTFHQLGLEIISNSRNLKIADNLKNVLSVYFLRDIYFTHDYLEYLEYLYIFKFRKDNNFYRVTNKIKVMTLEEVAIGNFLKLTHLEFKYKIINFNNVISQFTFFIKNNLVIINYLKKNKKYKRNKLICNLVRGENVLESLRQFLLNIGINDFKIYNNLDKDYLYFIDLCCTFINNYKVIHISDSYLKYLNKKYVNNYQLSLFIKIISKAYQYYNNYNINNGIIDFNDIINEAIKKLQVDKFSKYKYIIIDEAQDISKNRFEIIKLLNKYGANVIAFGDDWQSIFGFAGANVNLFVNFSKIIEDCHVLKITKTYRNSQQLIEVVGSFIMKNNQQLKKQLRSDNTLNKPVIINFYSDNCNIAVLVYKIICSILSDKPNAKILIIGRYNFSINIIIDNVYFKMKNGNLISLKLNANLTFLTAHASKGLTYDEVIILSINDELYGFPSKVNDNYELTILKEKEHYYLEEERRLFYVALTRTKNHNYLFSSIGNPSIFILELLNNKNVEVNNFTNKKIDKNDKLFCSNCGYLLKKIKRKKLKCPNCGNKLA